MHPVGSPTEYPLTDEYLLEAYRSRQDMESLGILYERYMHLVYGVCLKYLREPASAQDAVMNIFEELVAKLPYHQVEYFKSWLFVVAKNHCLMQLRKESRNRTTEIPITIMQSGQEEHLEEVEFRESRLAAMEECLEALPEDQRNAIRLFYLESKCYNEIVGLTGMEWNKVRSHIQNGRRNLKICMENKATPI